MSKVLCIYHGNCADGFGAAWCVRRVLGVGVEFHAGRYGEDPPNVRDRDVVIVDFSYKRSVLDEMASAAASLLVLDHHKTAAEDLAGLPAARPTWAQHFGYIGAPGCGSVGALFDMDRSGAGLAWDYFVGGPRPRLIDHIEDRDLWRFKLPNTREIQAALFSYPYDFAVWDDLVYHADHQPERFVAEGQAIERKHRKDLDELLGQVQRRMRIGGHDVPVANLPYTMASDAGNRMAAGQPFAATYFDTPEHRVFSLRSTPDGLDVGAIAAAYDGGGHRNASGFRRPLGWEGDV